MNPSRLSLICSALSRLAAAVACLALCSTRAVRAQDTTSALTDDGLRQLAEVVDGVRTGGRVWVVLCGTTAPYRVLGHYDSAQAAEAAAAQNAADNCHVYGPYVTTPDSGRVVAYGEVCRKRDDSSCASSDTTSMFSIADVRLVTVTFALASGRAWTTTFRPQDGEAIFFTMAAVDKLLIPYLHRVYGVDYAQRERARLLRSTSRAR